MKNKTGIKKPIPEFKTTFKFIFLLISRYKRKIAKTIPAVGLDKIPKPKNINVKRYLSFKKKIKAKIVKN